MNIATLTNSLKALFGTAASTTAIARTDLVPFMNSSGTPSGLSSISQLASVLGVKGTTSGDFNNITDNGTYFITGSNNPNSPTTFNRGFLTVSDFTLNDSTFKRQVYHECVNKKNEIWSRVLDNDWSTWTRIDNFGCNTASELATLLGAAGLMPISNTIETIDCNNVTTTGWKRITSSSTNAPTGISHGARLLHFVHDNGYNMQLIFDRTGDLYTRAQNNGTWSSWQQVYDTSLLTNSTLLSPLATALGAVFTLRKFDFTLEGTTPKEINITHGLFIIEGESGIRVIGACSSNSTTVTTIINGYTGGYGTFSMSKDVWGKLVVSQSREGTRQFTAYCIG